MSISRSTRFLFLLVWALLSKYRVALIGGLACGIAGTLLIFRLLPRIVGSVRRVEHIGVVGEFTPTTLPLEIQRQISLGLTNLAPDGSPMPALARSWEVSDGGKVYVFTLDTNAVWHGGKKLEAGDINYNIRSVTFTAVSANTLRVQLDTPFSPFLTLIAKPIFQRGLRGVGPYKVSGIKLNGTSVSYLKLTPVGNLSLPGLEYRFFKTEAQAIVAYKLGSVDILEDITDPSSLAGWKNTTMEQHVKTDRLAAIYFNLARSPLSDKTVRQALAYAVPDLGLGRIQSPIPATSWAFTDKVRAYTFDMARAKKLLGEPSATDSGHLTITTFSQYLDTAQKIAQSWTELGLTTDVRVENVIPDDFGVLLSAVDLPPDPDQYPFWHQTQTQTNITGYKNVKIDKLLEDGRQELDRKKRKEIYVDFQRRLTEDVPAIFLYHPLSYTITRRR